MNKHFKKYISLFLLSIFTCNIVIVLNVHTMALPVTMVMQQIPRMLMTAGACMVGIATSIWRSKQAYTQPAPAIKTSNTTTKETPNNHILSSIAADIKPHIEQAAKVQNPTRHTHVTSAAVANAGTITKQDAKPAVDTVLATATEQVATQEQKKLILAMPRNAITHFTIPGIGAESIVRTNLPNGVQYSACDGRVIFTLEWSDNQAKNEQRYQEIQKLGDLGHMRAHLKHNPQLRAKITQQLRQAVGCLLQTQSPDFIQRLHARMAMRGLWIDAPLVDNVLVTVNNLDTLFFHYDGTICREALHKYTQACESIVGLIDWIDYQIGDIIPRDHYISRQNYDLLKAGCSSNIFSYIYRWWNAITGRHCTTTKAMLSNADKFNADMFKCIDHCERYEFKAAEQLRDTHKSALLNDIIQYYKKVQIQQESQKLASLYDEHGIIRIAYNDPLYKQYKLELETAPAQQKNIINQNFLVRYHLKNTMHEKWGIPQSAPTCVHDALYSIMGTDCSALSDISLLQERIEQIVTDAPAEQRGQLVNAFYLPNGIFKEYALHDINVQAIKMPASIVDASSSDARQQLNTLIDMRIKHPQEAAHSNKAIECLQNSLNAKTAPERIKFKEQFDAIYNQVGGQTEKAKPVVTPQGGNAPIPAAPVPPDPDGNKKKKEQALNKAGEAEKSSELSESTVGQEVAWDMPTTGKKIDGRYYTKHALERMAPDTPQVRAELELRAIKKGYLRASNEFTKYIQPRNVPPCVVENVIKHGVLEINEAKGTLTYIGDGVKVVTNVAGDVVTVHVC